MSRIKIIVVVAVLAFAVLGGWRIAASEVANLELQEDMHDLAAKGGMRYGYVISEDDLREAVIHKAQEHDIRLDPAQVTVERTGSGLDTKMYLAADYNVPVDLPRYSLVLHFTPSSMKRSF